MSSSEAEALSLHSKALDRSESSPAAVSTARPMSQQHVSTQVTISESDSLPPSSVQQNPESVLDPPDVRLQSLEIENKYTYKFLDLKNMTDLEQRTLKGRLTIDYKCITASYSQLVEGVIQSLKRRSITPKQLSRLLMNLSAFRVQTHKDSLPLLADNLDSIRNAEDVDDVFYILRSYGSFFDCHIIKHIVTSDLCIEADRKELEKYTSELNSYCQRSVFECPHIENVDPKFQSFVMKVDDSVLKSSEMKAIDAFRVEVAEACGLEPHTFRLCSVEMGCLQLTFQVPPCVVNHIFPLTAEQTRALKRLGFLNLTCGGYSIAFGLDSSQHQASKV